MDVVWLRLDIQNQYATIKISQDLSNGMSSSLLSSMTSVVELFCF